MGKKTMTTTGELLLGTGKSHQALLTTSRHSGEGVGTQVGTMAADSKLYFITAAKTWKAMRIANNPRVLLAPCSGRGQALGPTVEEKLASGEVTRARALLRMGVLGYFWGFVFDRRKPGDKTAVYEVELASEEEQSDATRATFLGKEKMKIWQRHRRFRVLCAWGT